MTSLKKPKLNEFRMNLKYFPLLFCGFKNDSVRFWEVTCFFFFFFFYLLAGLVQEPQSPPEAAALQLQGETNHKQTSIASVPDPGREQRDGVRPLSAGTAPCWPPALTCPGQCDVTDSRTYDFLSAFTLDQPQLLCNL